MECIILGSGGCTCLPKPLCQCPICKQARRIGPPYSRHGCSLYLRDAALLVDTPEDIASALNQADIRAVDGILYSHWDPDHTMGMRVAEQLRLEWMDHYRGVSPASPVTVYAAPAVMEDLLGIRSKFGSLLDYYQSMGLIRREPVSAPLTLGDVTVTLVPVEGEQAVSVFVFEQGGAKLVYAPCDCTPFPDSPLFFGADVLIIGNTLVDNVVKNGEQVGRDHPLRGILHSMEDILTLRERLSIPRLIVTHLEEDWGKSYDDYVAMERNLPGVRFAFDGMIVRV